MPYTPPNPIPFSWAGAATYSPPSPVEFDFGAEGGGGGGGAISAYISSPSPLGAPAVVGPVTVVMTPPGFLTTLFGSPAAINAHRVTDPTNTEVTVWGLPTTPTYTEHTTEGRMRTAMGSPYGYIKFELSPVATITGASGWRETVFGYAGSRVDTYHAASSSQQTQWGAPRAGFVCGATTLGVVTTTSAAVGLVRCRAIGTAGTQWGQHSGVGGKGALGFYKTRFGQPRGSFPQARITYGWAPTRFGLPRGYSGAVCVASSASENAHLGQPVGVLRQHVAHLGQLTRFGRPTMRRNQLC
jgi:hypothetical protein